MSNQQNDVEHPIIEGLDEYLTQLFLVKNTDQVQATLHRAQGYINALRVGKRISDQKAAELELLATEKAQEAGLNLSRV